MFRNNYSVRNSLKKLFIQQYERYLPTAFDESLSLLEKMNKLIEAQNKLIDAMNVHTKWTNEKLERAFDIIDTNLQYSLTEFRDELEEQKILYEEIRDKVHSELVPDAVKQKLEEWLLNGSIEDLIKDSVFPEIMNRLIDVENKTEDLPISVKDFGATGDGVTDDSVAMQDAFDYAKSLGVDARVLIPKGEYLTSRTLSVSNTLDGEQATINYYGDGTALILGDKSEQGIVTARVKFVLPRVVYKNRGTDGWVEDSVGVECVNLNTCHIYVPFIRDFEEGLVMHGYHHGCTYNTVELGALWDNRRQFKFKRTGRSWSNQTIVVGGRLQQTLSKGAVLNDPDAKQIDMYSGDATSNNTFINTSIEGVNVSLYRIDISGSYNNFINLRTENMDLSNPLKIMYRDGARFNKITGGYHAHLIEEVFENNASGGSIDDGVVPYINARLKENLVVRTASEVGWHTVVNMDSQHHRVDYNPTTGRWTPRPGKWFVTAKISMSSNPNGAIYLRIVKNNGSVSAQKVINNSTSYIQTVDIATMLDFDGDDYFEIRVQQSSGEDLTMVRNSSNSVECYYLGGI